MHAHFGDIRMIALRLAAIGGGTLVLAACGGGGAASVGRPLLPPASPIVTPAPTAVPSSKTAVSIRVAIPAPPATASNKRRSKYVSPATNSLSFAQDGAVTTVVSLAAGSPNCSTGSGGTRTCTVNANATAGQNQSFTVKTFASANASGIPLSLQTLVATILPGATNPLNVTLDGVVASLRAAFAVPSLPYKAPGSTKLTVDALDAAGDTIVGPGTYADASGNAVKIALANSDASGSTALAQSMLAQPGAPVGFTYDGGPVATDTVTASAPGLSSAKATIAFLCASAPSTSALYVSAEASNPGYGLLPLSISGTSVPGAVSIVDPPGALGYAGPVEAAPIVDSAGRAYVSEGNNGAPWAIAEFCPQAAGTAAVPYRSVVVPFAWAATLDAARNLYVESLTTNTLSEYAADSGVPGFVPNGAAATTPLRSISLAVGFGASDFNGLPALATAGANVYASGLVGISVYGPGESGSAAPIASIDAVHPGLVAPQSVAVDKLGDVYVEYGLDYLDFAVINDYQNAYDARPAIAEYTAAGALVRTFATNTIIGFHNGVEIAVDDAGTVWTATHGSLESFGPTATLTTAPTNTWVMTGTSVTGASAVNGTATRLAVQQIAVDPATGHIYACDANGFGVLVYTASGALLGQIMPSVGGLGAAYGIVFDPVGNFVVQSQPYKAGGMTYGSAQLQYYPAGTGATGLTTKAPTKVVNLGSFAHPGPLAIDAAQNIYELAGGAAASSLSDSTTYTVAEFGADAGPNATPVATFFDAANLGVGANLGGIAIGLTQTVLVGNAGSNEVYAYPAGASGSSAVPTGAYHDDAPSTWGAHAMTTDRAGNLYAASFGGATITEYAAGTSNVVRSIFGPHTRLLDVTAMAVDDAGNLYVGNQDGLTLDVFGPQQAGDATPQRVVGDPVSNTQVFAGFAIGPGNAAGATPAGAIVPQSSRSAGWRATERRHSIEIICALTPTRCPGTIHVAASP